ncbi:FxDxF family PEP-CTERM protein [Pseudoduganella lutea]|uniref:PEP-CTERM sorting domain-containing protein n=1 Tax=Pseudoduganella lutea TaxID=321985 RepID=A0A4P6L225_9BURK|nr:FxDxF family PEP-CTERM protein [Pseudoduganella lutea]QBE65616.1 PEP-CTERM sorting domain-containing protein [Pseudoduganella lutea]
MKLHSIALAAVLAGAFGGASAETYNFDLKGGPTVWSTYLVASHGVGEFTDTFTFTNYSVTSNVATSSLINVFNGVNDIDFTSVKLNGVDMSFKNNDWVSTIGFNDVAVNGTLSLVVTGVVTGKVGTTTFYGGNFAVTAVPEPTTYGMLLGGMAVLGFAARRRKQG